MGEVYAATDRQLGRQVALKVIRTRHQDEQASRRALDEARLTARFNHPNIITIFAVGTIDAHTYLALELLEGRTLRDRIRAAPLPTREALRILEAVADALAEAHRHGVQHRDLKPSNIFLPDDGRPRVVDFGIAGLGDPIGVGMDGVDLANHHGHRTSGTPAYMAPEQWMGRRLTAAVDVWALGLILHEMVTGKRVNPGQTPDQLKAWAISDEAPARASELMPAVPAAIDALVLDCLRRSVDQRPTSEQVCGRIRTLNHRLGVDADEMTSPFLGLMPFTESDAGRFFGRESEVEGFVQRLREDAVLTVVGASGAGKTSFVQAGVIPRLRQDGPVAVIGLRPGRTPLGSLASSLPADALGTPDSPTMSVSASVTGAPNDATEGAAKSAVEILRASPGAFASMLERVRPDSGGRVFVFIDQLEEVVTLAGDHPDRVPFMDAISVAAHEPPAGIFFVFTLREEFLSRVAALPHHRPPFNHVTVLRNPPASALRKVVSEPVRAAGYAFDDPSVIDSMVRDVQGTRTALALLQFAGDRLWDERDEAQRLLFRRTYERMGGVTGALALHADLVMEGLSESQAQLARALWLRLVTADRTRRSVSEEGVAGRVGAGRKSRPAAVRTGASDRDSARG